MILFDYWCYEGKIIKKKLSGNKKKVISKWNFSGCHGNEWFFEFFSRFNRSIFLKLSLLKVDFIALINKEKIFLE